MTKFSNHPHNKSHSIAHSQSHSHHSGTKAVTHRSPVLAVAAQQKLLNQQTKSKNASVKTFKSPNASEVSLIGLNSGGNGKKLNKSSSGLSLCGVSGALAGLIPGQLPTTTTASNTAAIPMLPSVGSMSSVLDRFKAASTPTHNKKSVREQVVEKIQTILDKYKGKLGVHIVIGFNSIQSLIEKNPRHVSMLVIAKDCKEEFLQLLIKSTVQQRVPYLILPSFSNMLREACHVKNAFCFAVRSDTGLQVALKEYKENKENSVNKKKKRTKKKQNEETVSKEKGKAGLVDEKDAQITSTYEGTDDGDYMVGGVDLEEGIDEDKRLSPTSVEEELREHALEAAVDDLREYLESLIASENSV